MNKVILIGAGQLGSRHLQGIAKSKEKISIEVVEPFEQARKIAEERFNEVKNKDNVNDIMFVDSISLLSNHIDLAIIATSSNVRSKIIKELLDKKIVKYLVLEKVLFQTIEEYYEIEELLNKANVKCWVNHPRRMFPAYKKLKEELKDAQQLSYSFQGGDWGLGCNGLHFIDHLLFLTDSLNLKINNDALDDKIYGSKRKGFIEFNGLLSGKLDNHVFSLYSNNKEISENIFTIVSDIAVVKIYEQEGLIKIAKKENNWKEESRKEKIVYFQSELSNILVDKILKTENCDLPSYEHAMKLHIPFIKSLLNHMDKINGKKNKICPIT